MWHILLAELKYNWIRILISVILMTLPLNILISILDHEVILDTSASDEFNTMLLTYVTATFMFAGMLTTAPVMIRYFRRFHSKTGISISSLLPITPLQQCFAHILPIILINILLVTFYTISFTAFDLSGQTKPIINLLTINGFWLSLVFILLMWVEYGRIYKSVKYTGIAILVADALILISAVRFYLTFVGDFIKLFFKSLFLPFSAGAYSLLALIIIVIYTVMFTRRKSFLS